MPNCIPRNVLDNRGEPLGYHDKNGTIAVVWNSQVTMLEAPPVDGKRRMYLPCDILSCKENGNADQGNKNFDSRFHNPTG